MRKSKRLKTEPYGTPTHILRDSESTPFNLTENFLPVRKSFIHNNALPLIPVHWIGLASGEAVSLFVAVSLPEHDMMLVRSDEAHFWLNGYFNKQNYRIWSEANPQVSAETPLHPEKLTVWCALWAGEILLQKR
ncbi:hypothetical protein TNCV_2087091 [Trichonephila clavipes]|nr:hypothetical protein TNCV_2087091 [Trichonephila clavipes]